MPRTTARTDLTIPTTAKVDADFLRILNGKLRTIEPFLNQASTVSSGGSGIPSGGTIALNVPGTVAIMSNAAPLLSFSSSITPQEIVLLAKRAAIGAALAIRVNVAGNSYAVVTAAAGKTSASLKSTFAVIPANQLITVDIIGVGTTFPGADVSILIRL